MACGIVQLYANVPIPLTIVSSTIFIVKVYKYILSLQISVRQWVGWTVSRRAAAASTSAWQWSTHAAAPACFGAVIDLLLIFTRATRPPDKQPAKACARAVLPHSIPIGCLRLVRSPRSPASGPFPLVQLLTRLRRDNTTLHAFFSHHEPDQQHINQPKWSAIGYNVSLSTPY